MKGWSPLWSGIVESSIWDEPDPVRIVFVTMLAVKDPDHVVRMNAYNLARLSRKSEKEVLDALKVLESPDTRRVEPQPFDGRRIEKVEGGYLILNGEHYRQMVSKEMARIRNLRAQRAFRERQARKEAVLRNAPPETPHFPEVADVPARPKVADYPKNEQEARTQAEFSGVPPDFAAQVWKNLEENGRADTTLGPIRSFRRYLAAAWANEQQKPKKKGADGGEIKETINIPKL